MIKRSITGWVPADEKESSTLSFNGLDNDALKEMINGIVFNTRKEAVSWGNLETPIVKDFKKVRVTISVDVEKL